MKLEIFDPPMCCATGVCGTDVDPVLPQLAADLEWLKAQGISVARYNLAQEPGAFVSNEEVKAALHAEGNACLPLILLDGRLISRAAYPNRATLAAWTGVELAMPPETVPARRTLTILTSPTKCC